MRWIGGARCGWRGAAWMPDPALLVQAARRLLPPGCAVAAADPRAAYPLWPGEEVAGMTAPRRAEFSAGRQAARAALAALGAAAAVPHGPDRAPVWPAGTTGSITHSATACLAAVMRGAGGIGLDLEEDADLPAELWDSILLPEELARLGPDPGRAARLVFSAKEAAYKAQYAHSRRLFGFDTLAVVLTDGGFTATFRHPVGPFAAGHVLHGRHARAEGHILTAVVL
jgi:4'-phosphopantetheinyl transferase EntD